MIQYHTGLTDLSGVEGVYLSESMMSSVAYSAVYIRTNDEGDAKVVLQSLMDNINPAKWVCVSAEKQVGALFGNDIFLSWARLIQWTRFIRARRRRRRGAG